MSTERKYTMIIQKTHQKEQMTCYIKIQNQNQFILQALYMYRTQNYLPNYKMRSVLNEDLLKHYRLLKPLWKTVWNFLRKLKMELPFDLAIPLLGLYPKNPGTPIQKKLCTPMFIAAQFTIVKYWKQPKCPSVNEWVKKLQYIYTMEYYAAEGKKELLPFSTAWMELESIMLNEISQAVKDKYHMISPISGT